MKKILLLIPGVVPVFFCSAQYKTIDSRSSIKFTVKNFGFRVGGTFSGIAGDIIFDPKQPAAASFRVSVSAATVNTDNEMRDGHLKGESYFNTGRYPLITFESTKITAAPDNAGLILNGKLTIKNHSQEISFPFTAEPSGNGYLFKGSFSIDRRDFDVGGFSTISDNVDIMLSVFAGK